VQAGAVMRTTAGPAWPVAGYHVGYQPTCSAPDGHRSGGSPACVTEAAATRRARRCARKAGSGTTCRAIATRDATMRWNMGQDCCCGCGDITRPPQRQRRHPCVSLPPLRSARG
jgi:hypothetical protein